MTRSLIELVLGWAIVFAALFIGLFLSLGWVIGYGVGIILVGKYFIRKYDDHEPLPTVFKLFRATILVLLVAAYIIQCIFDKLRV